MKTLISNSFLNMNDVKNFLFFLYQWLIAFPIIIVISIITALITILLSPIFPNKKISYFPARWWSRICCALCFVKVKIRGTENIDPKQSYVFISNHQSLFDIFAIYGWLPSIFKWLMKIELRKIPLVGTACELAGHIFIDRSNPIAAQESIKKAEKKLKNGVSVVIFPEGTRTRDGKLGKFKHGAFRIATDLSLPIVPITIRGSFERISRSTLKITPGTIEMIIHQPIDVNAYLPNKLSELVKLSWETIYSELEK